MFALDLIDVKETSPASTGIKHAYTMCLDVREHWGPLVISTVSLAFRYTEADYTRALRAHYASNLRLRLDIVVSVILASLGVYLWYSAGLRWLGLACLVIAVGLALMLIAAFMVIPKIVFRREPRFRDDYSLTFSSDGIRFRTANVDSQLQWKIYTRALIDAHSYLLYYGSRQFTVIPRRVTQGVEQRQAFEHLLSQHLSQILRKDL
jgi:YcxB-like protein